MAYIFLTLWNISGKGGNLLLSCTVYNVDIYITTQRPARVHVPVLKYIRYTQAIAHFAVLGAQNNVTHVPSHIYTVEPR